VLFPGLGRGVAQLGGIPWLRGIPCLYWGDIDTHGFSILSLARSLFPQLRSVLMDEETFLLHKDLWVAESQHPSASLPGLTPAEEDLFLGLKSGRWGENVRLEQEKIAWRHAWPRILEAARGLLEEPQPAAGATGLQEGAREANSAKGLPVK
jgi:hypothetical protein